MSSGTAKECLFDCIVEKTDTSWKWNFVALVALAKNLSKMSSMLLTLTLLLLREEIIKTDQI